MRTAIKFGIVVIGHPEVVQLQILSSHRVHVHAALLRRRAAARPAAGRALRCTRGGLGLVMGDDRAGGTAKHSSSPSSMYSTSSLPPLIFLQSSQVGIHTHLPQSRLAEPFCRTFSVLPASRVQSRELNQLEG